MTKTDYEILAAFRYEVRKFLRFSGQAAAEKALTPQKYQALLAIEGFPGGDDVSIGDLAEQLQIAPNSAVGLVNRLETGRLIERRVSKDDRRRVLVKVTPLGRSLLGKVALAHRKELLNSGPLLAALLKRLGRLRK